MQADRAHLHKNIEHKLTMYKYRHNKVADIHAIGQMLSIQLYHRRFFPLYCYNVLAGVDAEGNGVVYSYDVVGCLERISHSCAGSARDLVEPLLDARIWRKNEEGKGPNTDMTKEEAVELAKEAFTSAGERDLETGDSVEIFVITADGVEKEMCQLRRD
eukprot:Sspe_Gene.691::Locus_237_Transcript_1_1_Confidence_1.000_Length_846::g.691::m.691/K02732/PSMB1; 20S proteasome subunit beta 6